MGFNSAFKGLKLLKKTPGNGRLNNLNDPVISVLRWQLRQEPRFNDIFSLLDGVLFLFTLINRLVSDSCEHYFFIKSCTNAIRGQLLVHVIYRNIILTGKLRELQQGRARSTLWSPLAYMKAGKNTSFSLINRNESAITLCFFAARSMSKTKSIFTLTLNLLAPTTVGARINP